MPPARPIFSQFSDEKLQINFTGPNTVFLEAELLYNSLCLSVGRSVGRLVGWLVCRGAFSFFERIIAKPMDRFD